MYELDMTAATFGTCEVRMGVSRHAQAPGPLNAINPVSMRVRAVAAVISVYLALCVSRVHASDAPPLCAF